MNTWHKAVGDFHGICNLCEGILVVTAIDSREHGDNIFSRLVLMCKDCGVVFTGEWK